MKASGRYTAGFMTTSVKHARQDKRTAQVTTFVRNAVSGEQQSRPKVSLFKAKQNVVTSETIRNLKKRDDVNTELPLHLVDFD